MHWLNNDYASLVIINLYQFILCYIFNKNIQPWYMNLYFLKLKLFFLSKRRSHRKLKEPTPSRWLPGSPLGKYLLVPVDLQWVLSHTQYQHQGTRPEQTLTGCAWRRSGQLPGTAKKRHLTICPMDLKFREPRSKTSHISLTLPGFASVFPPSTHTSEVCAERESSQSDGEGVSQAP